MPSKKKKYNARFPPARIKKIMQTDEDVGKVAAAVPVIISRALELFIESLIVKSADNTKSKNAKTLSAAHIKQTISAEKKFDFLKDLVANIPDVQHVEDEAGGEITMDDTQPGPSNVKQTPHKSTDTGAVPKKRGRPKKVRDGDEDKGKTPRKQKRLKPPKVVSEDEHEESDSEKYGSNDNLDMEEESESTQYSLMNRMSPSTSQQSIKSLDSEKSPQQIIQHESSSSLLQHHGSSTPHVQGSSSSSLFHSPPSSYQQVQHGAYDALQGTSQSSQQSMSEIAGSSNVLLSPVTSSQTNLLPYVTDIRKNAGMISGVPAETFTSAQITAAGDTVIQEQIPTNSSTSTESSRNECNTQQTIPQNMSVNYPDNARSHEVTPYRGDSSLQGQQNVSPIQRTKSDVESDVNLSPKPENQPHVIQTAGKVSTTNVSQIGLKSEINSAMPVANQENNIWRPDKKESNFEDTIDLKREVDYKHSAMPVANQENNIWRPDKKESNFEDTNDLKREVDYKHSAMPVANQEHNIWSLAKKESNFEQTIDLKREIDYKHKLNTSSDNSELSKFEDKPNVDKVKFDYPPSTDSRLQLPNASFVPINSLSSRNHQHSYLYPTPGHTDMLKVNTGAEDKNMAAPPAWSPQKAGVLDLSVPKDNKMKESAENRTDNLDNKSLYTNISSSESNVFIKEKLKQGINNRQLKTLNNNKQSNSNTAESDRNLEKTIFNLDSKQINSVKSDKNDAVTAIPPYIPGGPVPPGMMGYPHMMGMPYPIPGFSPYSMMPPFAGQNQFGSLPSSMMIPPYGQYHPHPASSGTAQPPPAGYYLPYPPSVVPGSVMPGFPVTSANSVDSPHKSSLNSSNKESS